MTAQNTTLTLRGRPFLFAGDIQLVRGQSQEVDISTLSPNQLKTLKKYVDAGQLESTMDLECSETTYACELKEKSEDDGDDDESEEEEEAIPVPEELKEEASIEPEELRSVLSAEEPDELEVSEDEEEAEPEEDEDEKAKELRTKYNRMRVTELKKEVKRLEIETEASTKKELVKVLVANGLSN